MENTVNKETAAGMTVQNPEGAHEILHVFAKRLDTLDGKIIAELGSDAVKWQPHRTFEAMEEEITKKYPTARFISFKEFPQGLGIADEAVAAAVKARGADACIIGNAA